MPYEVAEDEEGQQYYMVPLSRERRSPQSTSIGMNEKGISLSHKGNILDNNGHRLDGSAYASKNHHSPGLRPDQFGGQLDYNHDPSRTSAYLGADHARGYGTDVRAGVQREFYR
nr:unnamed protein product [Callosobruchus analis]